MPRKTFPPWIRFSGMGFEFAAGVAGFALVGLLVDRTYGFAPWGLIVGAVLGIIGATWNLIRKSLLAVRESSNKTKSVDRQDP